MMRFDNEGMGDDSDILSKAVDITSDTEVILISCPPEAIGGDGPVFEQIDNNTVYALVSTKLVENVIESGQNQFMSAVNYGMMMGDIMRRGMFYAQNKKRKRRNKNDQ